MNQTYAIEDTRREVDERLIRNQDWNEGFDNVKWKMEYD